MKLDALLEELEGAADQLGTKVRYERLSSTVGQGVGHGGLCKVRGEYRIIIDKRAALPERVATLARALARLDSSNIFLSPQARRTVDRYAHERGRRAS